MTTSTGYKQPPKHKNKPIVKVNAMAYAHLIKLLLEGTYTCQELADETGLHYVTVLHYTRELHKAGAAHICMWEKDMRGRDLLKVYKIGPGPDAKRSKLTQNERQIRYRAKKKQLDWINRLCSAQPAANEAASCQPEQPETV